MMHDTPAAPISRLIFTLALAFCTLQGLVAESPSSAASTAPDAIRSESTEYQPGDKWYGVISLSTSWYDGKGNLLRVLHHFSPEESARSGFMGQEELYSPRGILYVMHSTATMEADTGLTSTGEFMPRDGSPGFRVYFHGSLAIEEAPDTESAEFSASYPFWCLSYLGKQAVAPASNLIPSFPKARSFVRWASSPRDLDVDERAWLEATLEELGMKQFASAFTGVAMVEEVNADTTVTCPVFVQGAFAHAIKAGSTVLLSHVPARRGGKLGLLATAFQEP